MYSTGAPSSCAAVLQALATFASSAGWTVDNNAAYSGGWWLAVHKGSCYLNFVVPSGDGKITVYGATGFNSGSAPSAQANASAAFTTNPGQPSISTVNPGPYAAYHFFSSTSGTYLHCIIESSAGVFAHVHAGQLNAVGGASPAIYLAVSNLYYYNPTSGSDTIPSSGVTNGYLAMPFNVYAGSTNAKGTALGCTVDSTFRWFYDGPSVVSPSRLGALGYTGGNSWNTNTVARSPNVFNGLPVLAPIPFFAERSVGNIWSLIGEAPDVRVLNTKNNNAKDEITIGSDVWKVFPIIANSSTINTGGAPASSYPYGLAFKKSA